MSFEVKFWGVRGSIACPSPRHIGYGGNTSCVQVRVGGEHIILDAGTGIRPLGVWMREQHVDHATILLSHTHWDHINGFPFFEPAYRKDVQISVMAGHVHDEEGGIRGVLAGQMMQPYFPVPLEIMQGCITFSDFNAGDSFDLKNGVHVRTAPLNHPNGSTAYRIEYEGKSMCYVTDTEHVPGKPDRTILDLIDGADLVIYDSTYTDDEFPSKVGWGHSTWQEGVRLCRQAGVKMLAIFHHDPEHEDRFMDQVEKDAKAMWDGAVVAREHMTIKLV